MHLSVDSTKALDVLREDLRRALAANGLVIASESDAARRIAEAAVPSARGSFVFELRDPLPTLLHDAAATSSSTFKVAGYEVPGGATRLSTMRPTQLIDLLGHPELSAPALALERSLEAALKAAAGWVEPRGAV